MWNCLPVPSFGNPARTKVQAATIGLNPASTEFRDPDSTIRREEDRLPMLHDFEVADRTELTEAALRRAREKRDHYFSNKPHKWFRPMQLVLRGMNLGWSYAEGTAVNIDVVACATGDAIGVLPVEVRSHLMANCQKHFIETVSTLPDGTWLVVNGRGAFLAMKAAFSLAPNAEFSGRLPKSEEIEMFVGSVNVGKKTLRYFGWSANLHRASLAEVVQILDFWAELPAAIRC
jgi:hypothetical protein